MYVNFAYLMDQLWGMGATSMHKVVYTNLPILMSIRGYSCRAEGPCQDGQELRLGGNGVT